MKPCRIISTTSTKRQRWLMSIGCLIGNLLYTMCVSVSPDKTDFTFEPNDKLMYYSCSDPMYGWWSGDGAGYNVQCQGVILIWIKVGQGPTMFAVDAGGGCLDIFLSSVISSFCSLSLGYDPIYTEILSQRAVKSKTTNQLNPMIVSFPVSIMSFIFDSTSNFRSREYSVNLATK